jgi:hypothetical protein
VVWLLVIVHILILIVVIVSSLIQLCLLEEFFLVLSIFLSGLFLLLSLEFLLLALLSFLARLAPFLNSIKFISSMLYLLLGLELCLPVVALAARESEDLSLLVKFDCSFHCAHEVSHSVTNLLAVVTKANGVKLIERLPASDAVIFMTLISILDVSLSISSAIQNIIAIDYYL